MKKTNKKEKPVDVDSKKTLIIMALTAGIVLILVVLFVYPNLLSKISRNSERSEDQTPPGVFTFPSSTENKLHDVSFDSNFDSYNYSMSFDDIIDKCGTPNKKLTQSLTYNYVMFDTYISDMTFLFENKILYGCLYDILYDSGMNSLSVNDYYILKEYFISLYGLPVKTRDGSSELNTEDKMYSRWENNDSFIKLEIMNSDGSFSITIGYIEKSKADN